MTSGGGGKPERDQAVLEDDDDNDFPFCLFSFSHFFLLLIYRSLGFGVTNLRLLNFFSSSHYP